jgi:hypothetical protein
MRTNSFTNIMSKKSNAELETIIQEKSKYTEEAIQAVIWELENRNLIEKDEIKLEVTSKNIEQIEDNISDKVDEKNTSSFEEFETPALYSKNAILGFSIFFSTLFGAVLLMSNLKALKKPKERMQVLVFAVVYTMLSVVLLNYLPKMYFTTLIFNLLGYVILSEFFWNNYLGKGLQYKKKQISKPLIISILILVVLIFFQFSPQMLA